MPDKMLHKYTTGTVSIGQEAKLFLLKGTEVLKFDFQNGVPTIWCLVPIGEKEQETIVFKVFLTGDCVPEDGNWKYLGTAFEDWFVGHLFRKNDPVVVKSATSG